MLEVLTAVAALLIGGVVLVALVLLWESGILQALFYLSIGLLLFVSIAYAIGKAILDAVFS